LDYAKRRTRTRKSETLDPQSQSLKRHAITAGYAAPLLFSISPELEHSRRQRFSS
jgi:hypothetical protein